MFKWRWRSVWRGCEPGCKAKYSLMAIPSKLACLIMNTCSTALVIYWGFSLKLCFAKTKRRARGVPKYWRKPFRRQSRKTFFRRRPTDRFVLRVRDERSRDTGEFPYLLCCVISFHRLRFCSLFDRSERLHPSFRHYSFTPYLVFLFFTSSCSLKRLK